MKGNPMANHAYKPTINPELAERLAEAKSQRLIKETKTVRINWGAVIVGIVIVLAVLGTLWTVDAIGKALP
jgi:hypothetical protein